MSSSSDADYAAFLRGANTDHSAGYEASNRATHPGTAVVEPVAEPHAALRALAALTYTSETDAPFEAVAFNWHKEALPSAGALPPSRRRSVG